MSAFGAACGTGEEGEAVHSFSGNTRLENTIPMTKGFKKVQADNIHNLLHVH